MDNKVLKILYHDRVVGTMAKYRDYYAAFEYDKEWLADGFSISPYSLPLEKRVFIPKMDPFEGLFGVFADSLPDGWGRLLVDRLMKSNGFNPAEIGNLDRLAIVGNSGMGVLSYHPETNLMHTDKTRTLDEVAEECSKLLHEEKSEDLDYLFYKGGSSGGARPKIMTSLNSEEWIIKFPSSYDDKDIGKQEYDYALCAKECGIPMEEVKLFHSERCAGYFGTRRFDRTIDNQRIHMVSASGLLETSHRIPNLDYDLLMRLTLQLTKDMDECLKLYRLMCFNVFSHNRDDHSKNFTYLYLEEEKKWILSPAYDLTYSNSIGGEHATTIHGNGKTPGLNDILAVAKGIGISARTAKRIASDTQEIVRERLGNYLISF